MTKKQQATAIAGVLILSACGAEVYDAGSNDPTLPASANRTYPPYGPASESFGCVPGDPACYGKPCEEYFAGAINPGGGKVPPDVAGAWVGEFDDYALSSGSRAVRVEFRGNQDYGPHTGLCGVVTFGTGAPPPMPSDPDSLAAYPPGTEFLDNGFKSASVGAPASRYRYPYEGFQYEFYDSRMSSYEPGAAVRFGIMTTQIVKAYCDMQTAYRQDPLFPNQSTWYSCLPQHMSRSSGPDGCMLCGPPYDGRTYGSSNCEPVSCEKEVLCEEDRTCHCDETGCSMDYEPDALVDLMLNGDTATGSIAIDGIHSLHLTRAR
jgi:hypothetical protein